MSQWAIEWYKKGSEALAKKNFDFAAECFFHALKMEPDNKLYREIRHGCIERMYDGNGTGARMASVRLVGIRGKIKKARLTKKWAEVDLAAEEGLLLNPWDAQLYAEIGEAAVLREHSGVAQYAWTKAVRHDRNNIAYNRSLGTVLRECGEYKLARDCFKRIYNADPTDSEARAMMNQLDAESVMDRGGYDKADSTQDVKAADEQPVNAYELDRRARRGQQPRADAPGESEEMDLRHAIRRDPDNLNHYLRLGELYHKQRNLPQALEIYEQALEKSGQNTDVLELKEDVELDILRDKLADAAELARRNPDKTRRTHKASALQKLLISREIEVLVPRAERHPQDMRLRYDLAERYRKTKQYPKAIPLYQQATADSRLKNDSLVWLGECFVRNHKVELGRRQFDKALLSLNVNDHPEPFKLAHYWLGRIYETAGQYDLAENHYTEILSVDYDFRDTHQRLEELQGTTGGLVFDDDDIDIDDA